MSRPNFLVIGAPRCGTTWLHNILATHSDVFVPPFRKELHFFDQNWNRGVEWYESFFADAGSASAIGETTPSYLANRQAPERISVTLPGCRLLVVLRNPVDRAFSHYCHMLMATGARMSFEEALEENPGILKIGEYSHYLDRYLSIFGKDRLKVLIFERATRDVKDTFESVGSFLDISSNDFLLNSAPRNETRIPRYGTAYSWARRLGSGLRRLGLDRLVEKAKESGVRGLFGDDDRPTMNAETRKKLGKLYEEDIDSLETLLGTRLSEWR